MKYSHSGNKIAGNKVAVPKTILVCGYLSLSICCSVSESQNIFFERNKFKNIIYMSSSI